MSSYTNITQKLLCFWSLIEYRIVKLTLFGFPLPLCGEFLPPSYKVCAARNVGAIYLNQPPPPPPHSPLNPASVLFLRNVKLINGLVLF